jgi:ATP-binding cassette subfamily B protein
MQEIHDKKDEQPDTLGGETTSTVENDVIREDITLDGLSFQYEGPNSPFVLKDVSLVIPKGKITAIVGASGSGKTTLMKLLLGYYAPVQGHIYVGDKELSQIQPSHWRTQCGTVMQDGYIFTDSIARNIALDGKEVDPDKMRHAVEVANIDEFITGLPLGYSTKIGNDGVGISGGQKQRVFIARSVYKNPSYLFFDEATSALDANNEKTIIHNLNSFFINKTVIIIAHRLSTVKHADQIIVLDKGEIVEMGTHDELCLAHQHYYELVKNQLELGA